MNTQHTPGPWNTTPAVENEYAIRRVYSINTSGMVLAHVNHAYDLEGANARLIAAAPELLAALQAVTDLLSDRRHDNDAQSERAVEDARAAIAKAVQS